MYCNLPCRPPIVGHMTFQSSSSTCHTSHAAGMQVASRLWILWGIVHLVPEAVTARQVAAVSIPGTGGAAIGLSLATLTSVWALSEVLRYGHFAAKV